jgi:hypothetical protein
MSYEQLSGQANFLADLAGIEFECSIAAAELNKSVHISMAGDQERRERTIVGVEYEAFNEVIENKTEWFFDYHGERVPIVLVKPVSGNKQLVPMSPEKRGRRWLSKRVVDGPQATPENEPTDNDPMMALRFNEVIMPFAGFAMRLDSDTCSYVQLGSEVTSDTLFATKLDEATSRNDIVEAMRDFTIHEHPDDDDMEAAPPAVSLLIETELARQEQALRLAFEKQLAQVMTSRFNTIRSWGAMQRARFVDVVDGKGSLTEPMYYEPLTPRYDLNGDHLQGWLALTRYQGSKSVDLGVVARGAVFRPLLRADADGALTSVYDRRLPLHTLRQLSRISSNQAITDRKKTPEITHMLGYTDHEESVKNSPWLYPETIVQSMVGTQ